MPHMLCQLHPVPLPTLCCQHMWPTHQILLDRAMLHVYRPVQKHPELGCLYQALHTRILLTNPFTHSRLSQAGVTSTLTLSAHTPRVQFQVYNMGTCLAFRLG